MEETKFDRASYTYDQALNGESTGKSASGNQSSPGLDSSIELGELKKDPNQSIDTPENAMTASTTNKSIPSSVHTKKSYMARLKPIEKQNLRHKNHLVELMARPIILLSFPIIAYAGFLYGCNIVWLSVLNATESMVFSSKPYGMSNSIVGLTFIAPLVGTTLA